MKLIPSLNRGGTEQYVLNITQEFLDQGHEVKIIVFSDRNHFSQELDNLNIVRCNYQIKKSLFHKSIIYTSEYDKIIDDFKPDVIHSHSYFTDRLVYEHPIRGIKYFSHLHLNRKELFIRSPEIFFNKKYLAGLIDRKMLFDKVLKAEGTFFAPSTYVSQLHEKHWPKRIASRIKILHNGVDTERFLRKNDYEFGKNGVYRLVSVGRLETEKNYDLLLQIAEQLAKEGMSFTLDIYGEGKERQRLETLVKYKGLQNRISFLGNSNNLHEILKEYDLCISTSLAETFGLSVLEAMAACVPVIAYFCQGYLDFARPAENCILISSQSEEEFVSAIKFILNNPLEYRLIAEKGKETARNFSIKRAVQELINYYK